MISGEILGEHLNKKVLKILSRAMDRDEHILAAVRQSHFKKLFAPNLALISDRSLYLINKKWFGLKSYVIIVPLKSVSHVIVLTGLLLSKISIRVASGGKKEGEEIAIEAIRNKAAARFVGKLSQIISSPSVVTKTVKEQVVVLPFVPLVTPVKIKGEAVQVPQNIGNLSLPTQLFSSLERKELKEEIKNSGEVAIALPSGTPIKDSEHAKTDKDKAEALSDSIHNVQQFFLNIKSRINSLFNMGSVIDSIAQNREEPGEQQLKIQTIPLSKTLFDDDFIKGIERGKLGYVRQIGGPSMSKQKE